MTKTPQTSGWKEQKKEEILFIAQSTTPYQRIVWLEEMVEFFRTDILTARKKRES